MLLHLLCGLGLLEILFWWWMALDSVIGNERIDHD